MGGREFTTTSGSPGRGNGLGGGVEPRTAKTAPPQEALGAGLRLRVACEPGAGFAHARTEHLLTPLPAFALAAWEPGLRRAVQARSCCRR